MLAGEFADDGVVVFKVVEADGAGGLREGDVSFRKVFALSGSEGLR